MDTGVQKGQSDIIEELLLFVVMTAALIFMII